MARLITWTIVALAGLNVLFLTTLPLFARNAAETFDAPRPAALPPPLKVPEPREVPVVPISELNEALRLPRVDQSLTGEHSRASVAAYKAEDYEKAFEEAVLALDPAPLEENELHAALMSFYSSDQRWVTKPNGRAAAANVDEALQPVLSRKDPQTAARLNNAAAMLILHKYSSDEPLPTDGLKIPNYPWMATELAHQAADLQPDYCPALLNLTLFAGMRTTNHLFVFGQYRLDWDLDHAGGWGGSQGDWTDHYSPAGCDDPALLYYRAQNLIGFDPNETDDIDPEPALRLADRLQTNPRWAGLAHSLKGDAYYWAGVYSVERTDAPRPFAAERYFGQALREYDAALALQPDDPAIHHGKALVYLEQGKADRREDVDEESLDRAIRESTAALESGPYAPRIGQTLVKAHEEKGDHAAAARLNRRFLEEERPNVAPLELVPYSALSHGADQYSELRVIPPGGGAGAALMDDEVIEPFVPTLYDYSSFLGWYVPGGLKQYLSELCHYRLLRDDLLAGDRATLREDLERSPEEVRRSESTLLLVASAGLMSQPEGSPTPSTRTQEAIDAFLEAAENVSTGRTPGYDPRWQGNDVFYREAGNFFRQHKQYENAIRIYETWRIELEQTGADDERKAEAERLLGETHFLRGDAHGDYDESLAAFNRAEGLRPNWPPYVVRRAFIHEKLEDYGQAERLYRVALEMMHKPADWMDPSILDPKSAIHEEPIQIYYPDGYQASKHLGDVILRRAEEAERSEGEDSERARTMYAEAAEKYRTAIRAGSQAPSAPAALNNLGLALVKAGDLEEGIKVLETVVTPLDTMSLDPEAVRPVEIAVLERLIGTKAPEGWWKNSYPVPPKADERNPVVRLNLGWAYELNGEPEKAEEHYLAAVRSEPTFHPALNDLGVLAAKEGRQGVAQAYLGAALEEEPGYAHASHNMGVVLLESGLGGVLAAQGFLARAVALDPSLSQAGYGYILDNGLYFLELSLAGQIPPGWEFERNVEEGMGVTSLLAFALILGRAALGFARTKAQETLLGRFISEAGRYGEKARLPGFLGRLRDAWFRFLELGVPSSGGPWLTPLAFLVSAPAVVFVVGWGLFGEDAGARTLMLGSLLYLVVVSLLVHHAGHALAAMWFGIETREAPWPTGIVQAVALVVIGGPAVTPVPVNVVEEAGGKERERSLVFLAGPAASIVLAVLLFVLFLLSHVPLLRLGAAINLTLAAVSLLLLPPLDGAMVGRGRYARLLFWAGVAMAILAVLAYFSNQVYCQLSPGELCWGI